LISKKESWYKDYMDSKSLTENLNKKIQNYEKAMRETTTKYVKLEELFVKTSEALNFSQQFIMDIEPLVLQKLPENPDESSNKLKFKIHKIIEDCIKKMVPNE